MTQISNPFDRNIRSLFSDLADTYEPANHILTLGLDILWRKQLMRLVSIEKGAVLDLCTGTGETAANLRRKSGESVKIFATDFSWPMLSQAVKNHQEKSVFFSCSDVKQLPFRDESFDAVTLSFATRNLNLSREILTRTFSEIRRVLKPGGKFVNLETSQPPLRLIRMLAHAFIALFVRRIGARISGSQEGYTYLSETIRLFYDAETLREILLEAGFQTVKITRLFFGIAAIHVCGK